MSRSEAPASGEGDRALKGTVLLKLARSSVLQALGEGGPALEIDLAAPWLAAPGATFVTLMKRGALRGCVGSLEVDRALREDVWENARAAAFRDPRFPKLLREELQDVVFEVSLLGAPEALPSFPTEPEALACLRPEVDGVVLEYRGRRATFLPQVWEQIPDPAEFLAQLKRKAGLPPQLWSRDLRLSVYSVEKWKEPSP
jgi:AmmeMemoRadiSam system protein A